MEEETVPQSAPSTYEWFSTNPLANSCGSALSSLYSVSKNYNRMTSWTFGTVESVVCYAADKAKPVVGAVTERLERPISAVDGIIAGGLVKLEDKYPVVGKEPSEIANEGKELIYNTFQAGQETLGNTRAGRYLGCGVDYTLAVTEGLVDKILPPLDEKEDEGESKEATKEVTSIGADDTPTEKPRSWFGLRRRKNVKKSNEDDDQEEDEQDDKVTPKKESRSTRVYNISYAVYYRSLTRLQSLQREVSCYLRRLKISLKLLEYAKSIKTGVGKQKENVAQALKDAETKLREYLTCKPQTPPNDEFASWLTDDKEDEDIKWLLESDKKKKDVFQQALDYAKAASEKVYEMLKSLSSVTDYLPTRLRDGATAAVEQAKNVYITLKLNNVPSELPAFLLTQTVEIVETQIIFCKKVGTHISSALKQRFGYSDDTISETSSQDIAEVHLDLDEEEKMDAEEDDEKGSESEGSTE